jgi:hypothetical protein
MEADVFFRISKSQPLSCYYNPKGPENLARPESQVPMPDGLSESLHAL